MEDEIKEILDNLKDNIPIEEYRSEGTSDSLTHYEEDKDSWQYKLYNYITNLKEKLEGIKDNFKIQLEYDEELENKITNLQEENQRLKEIEQEHKNCTRKHWQQKAGENYLKYRLYKSRCEKAIEYINKNKHLSMFADCREPEEDWNYDLEINPRELLNILIGDDE